MLINGITPLNCKCSGQHKSFQNNSVKNQSQPAFKAWGCGHRNSRHFSYWFMDWIKSNPSFEEIAAHLKKIEPPHLKDERESDITYLQRLLKEKTQFKDLGTTEIDEGRKYSSLDDYDLQNPEPKREERPPGMPESD